MKRMLCHILTMFKSIAVIGLLAWAPGQAHAQFSQNVSNIWNSVGTKNLGIGTSTPRARLEVVGGDVIFNGLSLGRGPGFISSNSILGASALFNNISGEYQTAIGSSALEGNTKGWYNTAVGARALAYSNGKENTALGAFAGTIYLSVDLDNTTALGMNANTTASNQVRIGNSSVTSIGGYTNWTNISDARMKTNVKNNVPGLAFISKLRPVTYNLDTDAIARWLKTPDSLRDKNAERLKSLEIQSGFIAQEVEQAAQELGFEFSGVDKPKNANDVYGLRYAEFTVPVVKAIQEQQKQIESQQQKIEALEKTIRDILAAINKN